jgi:hypothetical protein
VIAKLIASSRRRVVEGVSWSDVLPFVKRITRAGRYAATDNRIPKLLRWAAAVGLLPVPGPTDLVLLIAAVPLGLFYREPLADAWRRSAVG